MTEPTIVIEGIEDVIERDLEKHKSLLDQTKVEFGVYRNARAHEIKRKKHFRGLIGGGKYNDDALRASMEDIAINIRHLSDKAKTSERKIAHHTLIVETLTEQLTNQNAALRDLAEYRRSHGSRH